MTGEITITDRAAEKIRKLLAGAKEGYGLRVRVVEGGCSGYEYKMKIDSPAAEDEVFEKNGARILLDAKSMLHLDGTEFDFTKTSWCNPASYSTTPTSKGLAGAALLLAPERAKDRRRPAHLSTIQRGVLAVR